MTRHEYMTRKQLDAFKNAAEVQGGDVPRTHENCEAITGVSRPGKTAQDKARGVWSTRNSKRGKREVIK